MRHGGSNTDSVKYGFLPHLQDSDLLRYLDSDEVVLTGSNVIKENTK